MRNVRLRTLSVAFLVLMSAAASHAEYLRIRCSSWSRWRPVSSSSLLFGLPVQSDAGLPRVESDNPLQILLPEKPKVTRNQLTAKINEMMGTVSSFEEEFVRTFREMHHWGFYCPMHLNEFLYDPVGEHEWERYLKTRQLVADFTRVSQDLRQELVGQDAVEEIFGAVSFDEPLWLPIPGFTPAARDLQSSSTTSHSASR